MTAPPTRPDTAAGELHIASLLVQVRPDREAAVRTALAAMPGTEIALQERAKMVVTLEGPDEGWIAGRMSDIQHLDGVLAALLVFHHAGPAEAGAI
ncbi:chaperone NapD [Azospirillum thermophilum]|uniref:Chaperone NapD n=1 Tax=Azospirillum thermophilum TaxID=2202148 RepID=A0A2S2CZJ3_9PROT|nr:chaperone NapD [Azospirillum thermophilum]AWK89934.1 nitrate reductase [Azospirillum thermophilum]